jgi:hypothetical protein
MDGDHKGALLGSLIHLTCVSLHAILKEEISKNADLEEHNAKTEITSPRFEREAIGQE